MSYESRVLAFRNLSDEIMRKMPVIEGKTFENEDVYIDFYRYSKCGFTNCTLILEFGMCSLTHCNFSGCRFEAKTGSPASFVLAFDREIRESAFRERHR